MKQPIAVEDVEREVKILQLLSGHPNVVQFIDVFEDTELVYIAMELCEGGELLDRILGKKDNRYSEKDAASVVRQMLNVVARCHLNGVVHRDLKPENFLFANKTEESPLKATDFGLSDFRKPGKHFTDVVGSAYYVAPEVLKRRSGPESDVWSIGVITYILLSGRRPFWDKTEAGIFNEVLKKKPDFREKPWPQISSSAKDFVKKLLKKDPRARPTAAQALSHPWVKEGGNASSIPLDIAVLSNMREFVKYSRLKQMALKALATTLESTEVQQLRDQFNAMDINGDGTITIDEIRHALNKDLPYEVKETKVVQILQAMDTNCDGIIDFDEFVAATIHVQQLEEADSAKWEERSKAAFNHFDTDGDGFIDAEELRVAAQVKGSLGRLIDEGDVDGDGRISLPDFLSGFDLVFTTYNILASECPPPSASTAPGAAAGGAAGGSSAGAGRGGSGGMAEVQRADSPPPSPPSIPGCPGMLMPAYAGMPGARGRKRKAPGAAAQGQRKRGGMAGTAGGASSSSRSTAGASAAGGAGAETAGGGPLMQVKWRRVILDEAHVIKSVRTRAARAATALQAERRWAVTGTPVQNQLGDLFSLLCFLRLDPLNDRSIWTRAIERPMRERQHIG
ncbi:unnamed protein product, partial [Closterium sp. NIES-53]